MDERKLKLRVDLMMEGKSSMLYWYPKIKNLAIPQPRTVIVELEERKELDDMLDGDFSALDKYWEEIRKKAREIGFPLFMRTDLSSGKHEYKRSCYVEKLEDIRSHLFRIIDLSGLGLIGMPYKAIVFREFIPLDSKFTAWKDLPVARERRYFVNDGKLLCHHPYWFQDAIERVEYTVNKPPFPDYSRLFSEFEISPDNIKKKGWREELQELNIETVEEIELLTKYAETVGEILNGYWSVDFAKGENGVWYLIDCAMGLESFHVEDCPQKDEMER
jgi:hypothetical protein